MRKEVEEELKLPNDLRSLRIQLDQSEDALAASKENVRRKIHNVESLREKVQIREWQEEPEKRQALDDLLYEIDEFLQQPEGGAPEALLRARARVQELLDAPVKPYQRR